jgi:hypothetical protein
VQVPNNFDTGEGFVFEWGKRHASLEDLVRDHVKGDDGQDASGHEGCS